MFYSTRQLCEFGLRFLFLLVKQRTAKCGFGFEITNVGINSQGTGAFRDAHIIILIHEVECSFLLYYCYNS